MTRQLPPPLAAYLARIGAAHHHRADPATLRELQLRHLLTVPFENLSIHLGEPILLDPQALVDKVVQRRRGGFCYELNGAFATLLAALGFPVTLLAARGFGGWSPWSGPRPSSLAWCWPGHDGGAAIKARARRAHDQQREQQLRLEC